MGLLEEKERTFAIRRIGPLFAFGAGFMRALQMVFSRIEGWIFAILCAALVIGDGLALALYYVLLASLVITRAKLTAPLRGLLFSYGAFLLWAALTVILAGHGRPRSGDATHPLAWGGIIVCALALRHEADERTQRAMRGLAAATVIVSLFGVAQYLFDMSIVGVWLRVPAARLSVQVPGDLDHSVASGFFFNRLKFAFTLGAVLPLLAFLWRTKIAVKFIVCAIAAMALALTYSRSAMIAAACALVAGALAFVLAEERVSMRQLAVGACGAVLAAMSSLLVPGLRARLVSIFSTDSYSDREFIWARALEMRRDNPIFGVGFGNYPRVCQSYYDAIDPSFVMRTHAHDQWLSILVEAGPLGLVLFVCWLLIVARLIWRQRSLSVARFAAGVASFVNLLILMLVHDALQSSGTCLVLPCALGVALAALDSPTIETEKKNLESASVA